VALGILGWSQLAAFRDPFVPWAEDAALLLATPWGFRWKTALALAGLTLLALVARPLRPLGFLLPFLLAAYPALSGHAAAVETWSATAVASDWLHVLGAGAWMGSLAVLLVAGGSSPPRDALLVRQLGPFSRLARSGVAVVVLTGVFASWLHLGSVEALWTHPYGRVLGLKLVLVLGLMGLGAYNWRVLTPAAGSDEGAQRLVATARYEAVAGAVVLAITGWLTGMAPPP